MRIEIEDNGPGIPADKREEVFRPFYRLDESRNQDTGNSGLGLAIARDIARSHGGDIWLEKSETRRIESYHSFAGMNSNLARFRRFDCRDHFAKSL